MSAIPAESLAEGLALIAEGLVHVEVASTAEARQSALPMIRGMVHTLMADVGYPEAQTWSNDPQWVSPFTERAAGNAVKSRRSPAASEAMVGTFS